MKANSIAKNIVALEEKAGKVSADLEAARTSLKGLQREAVMSGDASGLEAARRKVLDLEGEIEGVGELVVEAKSLLREQLEAEAVREIQTREAELGSLEKTRGVLLQARLATEARLAVIDEELRGINPSSGGAYPRLTAEERPLWWKLVEEARGTLKKELELDPDALLFQQVSRAQSAISETGQRITDEKVESAIASAK